MSSSFFKTRHPVAAEPGVDVRESLVCEPDSAVAYSATFQVHQKAARHEHFTIRAETLFEFEQSSCHRQRWQMVFLGVSDSGSMLGSLWARRLQLLVPALETQALTSGRKMA